MIRTITITVLTILLSASLLFTMISPLIPTALDVYYRDTFEMTSKLFILGIVISFILGTILTLVCVFWKDKKED